MATILLVDNDAGFLTALERHLLRDGHRVCAATETAAALELIGQGSADLVIADLQLWHESGLDLLAEMRRQGFDLPVILLSASPDAASYLDALRLGAYEFLAKPSDFTELRQVVERALSQAERVR